jgi:hypothetical protein
MFQTTPALETIDEGAVDLSSILKLEYLSTSMQELTENSKPLSILC